MQHQEMQSPEALRDTIQGFWYTSIDFEEFQSIFEILPDGYPEIVFLFGGECSISVDGALQPLHSPFLVGLLDKPVLLHSKNRLEIIGIRCFPWTVFDLLGLSSDKNGIRILKHPVARLQSSLRKLIQVGNIQDALVLVKDYFLQERFRISTKTMLSKAGIAMSDANGTMPVKQVAEAAHTTVRTLERNFKQASGYTVKDVSGLMRFEKARDHLWMNPNPNLAGLAQDLGYSDQAHLSREFKRYSGITPAAFVRKVKKAKQDLGNDFVAFIQA